jgi:hypothetical protein
VQKHAGRTSGAVTVSLIRQKKSEKPIITGISGIIGINLKIQTLVV